MREPQEGKFTIQNRPIRKDWNYNYTSLKTALKKLNPNGELWVHVRKPYIRRLVTNWFPEMKYLAGYYGWKGFKLTPFKTEDEAIKFLESEINRFKIEYPHYDSDLYDFIKVK